MTTSNYNSKFKKGQSIKSLLSPSPKEILEIRPCTKEDYIGKKISFDEGTLCYVLKYIKGNGNISIWPVKLVDGDSILDTEKGYWED